MPCGTVVYPSTVGHCDWECFRGDLLTESVGRVVYQQTACIQAHTTVLTDNGVDLVIWLMLKHLRHIVVYEKITIVGICNLNTGAPLHCCTVPHQFRLLGFVG